ncbi:polysaccharide biosynthesis protein [Cryptosporangium minutisporangium]|uniref:Polysaccharide biosynthesis protein CapD-like domain-containing protein n=1 Tax=Cryptosporangium minutisporangium TaxID=113569 RepID=A0ABP6T9I4_9ACTN
MLSRAEIIDEILALAPAGDFGPNPEPVRARLWGLTSALIKSYDADEPITVDPMEIYRQRAVPLETTRLADFLRGKRVLVTGAAGAVGSEVVAALANRLPTGAICALDLRDSPIPEGAENRVVPVIADIRDLEATGKVFAEFNPEIVYHLAAQREPGLAEFETAFTISTNITGTRNVLTLCDQFGVDICVHASTGKAARYYTPDIYAGSKKVAEWMIAEEAPSLATKIGMVRFTHIAENSIVFDDFRRKVDAGVLNIHEPYRLMYVQSMSEAVALVLNTTLYVDDGEATLVTVGDLGWPLDILRLALHTIAVSGRDVPLCFMGLPAGYEKHTFLGQLDWSDPCKTHPMLNALESDDAHLTEDEGMMISRPSHPSVPVAAEIERLCADVESSDVDDRAVHKKRLADFLQWGCRATFDGADPAQRMRILTWGCDPDILAREGATVQDLGPVVPLLVDSLRGAQFDGARQGLNVERVTRTLRCLSEVPELKPMVDGISVVSGEVATTA